MAKVKKINFIWGQAEDRQSRLIFNSRDNVKELNSEDD